VKSEGRSRVTRGLFVRSTTDRFSAEGVPRGAKALTLFRKDADAWTLNCGGDYMRNSIGDRRELSGRLIVPASTGKSASDWLVDVFPAVTGDDLDFA
jgi:hypothetical protein